MAATFSEGLGDKGGTSGRQRALLLLPTPRALLRADLKVTFRKLTADDKAVARLGNLLGQMSLRVLPGTAAFQPRQKGGARGSVPRAWGQQGAGEVQPLGQHLGLHQEVPAWCCCWP